MFLSSTEDLVLQVVFIYKRVGVSFHFWWNWFIFREIGRTPFFLLEVIFTSKGFHKILYMLRYQMPSKWLRSHSDSQFLRISDDPWDFRMNRRHPWNGTDLNRWGGRRVSCRAIPPARSPTKTGGSCPDSSGWRAGPPAGESRRPCPARRWLAWCGSRWTPSNSSARYWLLKRCREPIHSGKRFSIKSFLDWRNVFNYTL